PRRAPSSSLPRLPLLHPQPRSTLFPYTTLFRSHAGRLEVFPRQNSDHAWFFLRGLRVDPADPGVSVRAPNQGEVRHALEHHVVGEGPLTCDEPRVLFARNTRADVGGICCSGHRVNYAATLGRAPGLW